MSSRRSACSFYISPSFKCITPRVASNDEQWRGGGGWGRGNGKITFTTVLLPDSCCWMSNTLMNTRSLLLELLKLLSYRFPSQSTQSRYSRHRHCAINNVLLPVTIIVRIALFWWRHSIMFDVCVVTWISHDLYQLWLDIGFLACSCSVWVLTYLGHC